jgi:CheY-like chemotaxis protein
MKTVFLLVDPPLEMILHASSRVCGGDEVLVARGLDEALPLLTGRHIDVVIAPIGDMRQSGLEVLRRARMAKRGVIGVLLVEGAPPAWVERATESGAVDELWGEDLPPWRLAHAFDRVAARAHTHVNDHLMARSA